MMTPTPCGAIFSRWLWRSGWYSLLNLQAAGEHIHETGDFTEATTLLLAIRNVRLPKNGSRLCSAQAEKSRCPFTTTISS